MSCLGNAAMNPAQLLAHFDRISEAPDAIPRLRCFILDLAVRGKLVEQDQNDEPAGELLKRIQEEKAKRIKAGEMRSPRVIEWTDSIEKLFPVFNSWAWVRLADVGAIVGGGTPQSNDADNFTAGGTGIAWLTPADLGRHNELYVSHGSRDITEKGLKSSSATLIPKDSVLFTSRAPIGYTAISANEITTNQGFKSVVPYITECSRYIALYLKAFGPWIDSKASGTTFREVSGKVVSGLPIPLPPLPEQHRIVSKIEQLFTDLDKGIEYLKTAQQQLKVYRQAVLKWAFEGRLTNENVVDGELPKGWFWKAIEDVADISTGVTPLRTDKSFWENGTIPWITSGALNDTFVYKAEEFVTQKAFDETTLKLLPKHTLLLALYGEGKTRGKCSELMFESTTNQAIAGIKLKKEFEQSRNFLKWFLLKNYQDIRLLSAGGVQPNLNSTIVKKTPFPFPSRNEQTKIVKEIESRLSVCDKIEEIIETSLLQAEALRLSILKKAFEGKLVKQNPTDEPAQKLLEKIRAEMKKNAPGIQEKEVKIKPLKRKLNKHERK